MFAEIAIFIVYVVFCSSPVYSSSNYLNAAANAVVVTSLIEIFNFFESFLTYSKFSLLEEPTFISPQGAFRLLMI